MQTADELFNEVERAYKDGRSALQENNLEHVRTQSIKIGELALKAFNRGLDGKKYGIALIAQERLISEYQRRRKAS